MKLGDLDPRWLQVDGQRMGFVFKCPHCQKCYLSVFFVPMAHIAGDDYHDSQYALFATVLPKQDVNDTIGCKRGYAWGCHPPAPTASFDTLSVTPSLDASAAGHWHGFITNGEIQ